MAITTNTAYTIARSPLNGADNLASTSQINVLANDLNVDTTLSLVGKDLINYGEAIAQNSVKLLENFASSTAPVTPTEGQMWWDTGATEEKVGVKTNDTKALKIWHITTPGGTVPGAGGTWLTLHSLNNGVMDVAVIKDTASNEHNVLVQKVNNTCVSITSSDAADWIIHASETYYEPHFRVTATHTSGAFVVGIGYTILTTGTTDFTLIGAANSSVGTVFVATGVGAGTGTAKGAHAGTATIGAGINLNRSSAKDMKFHGTATYAQYADVAELYTADIEHEPGTLVVLSDGEHDVTDAKNELDDNVLGVVTTNPALLMNSMLGGTTVGVALLGRVPCNVTGIIKKGDRIISSNVPGHGQSYNAVNEYSWQHVIGRALEAKTTLGPGTIEVIVGVK